MLTAFKLWSRMRDHYLRSAVVCISAMTAWRSGSSPAIGGAVWSSRPGFESPSPQLSVEVLVASISIFGDEYLAGLQTLPLMLSFDHPSAGPWRQKRHSGGNTAPLPAIEDVFESSRSPASNRQSGAGPAGHLGRSFVHFLSSIV